MDFETTARKLLLGLISAVALSLIALPSFAQRSVPITVQNDAANAVPVRQAIDPINADVQYGMSTGLINPNFRDVYTVPTDSRLVIESVSFWTFTTSCAFYLKPSVLTTAGGKQSEFRLEPTSRTYSPSGSSGFYTNQTTQSIRLYADPGSTVRVSTIRTDADCAATIRASIAGYLVPID